MRRHHLVTFTIVFVLVLIIGACGGGGDDPTATTGAGISPVVSTATATASPTSMAEQLVVNGVMTAITTETITDYGILAVGRDGQNLHRIGNDGNRDYFPTWSPDGRQLAFTRFLPPMDGSETPRAAIVVANADGSNVRVLTTEDGMAINPIWSPDGRQIAFERVEDPSQPEESWQIAVSVMNSDGSDLLDVGSGTTIVTTPSWSPDSTTILYGASQQPAGSTPATATITVVRADGSDSREIIGSDVLGTDMVLSADWSPDGSKIAFVRFVQPSDASRTTTDRQEAVITLWVADADGSNPRVLVNDDFMAAFFPAWSPDSSQLAFVGWEDQFNTGVYTINADGSDLKKAAEGLTGDIDEGEESVHGSLMMAPSWSPDGSWITYLAIPFDLEQFDAPVVSAALQMVAGDGSEGRTIVDGFYVEPVMDPFDSMGSAAPAWQPGHE